MSRVGLVGAALMLWAVAVSAAPPDATTWLSRIGASSQRVSYTGVFIYQSGRHSETSRIVHLTDPSGEYERLETLDGPPVEIVRTNADIQYFLPLEKLVISDKVKPRQFPAWAQAFVSTLSEQYTLRLGSLDRVAGMPAQQIMVDPRDELRYGHVFWVDPSSGLLLKSRMVNVAGDVMEQFAFSEVTIGTQIDRDKTRARYAKESASWRLVDVRGEDIRGDDCSWVVRAGLLPGFRQISAMRRPTRREGVEATHMVFSDGLATISVFVEPVTGMKEKPQLGESRSGSTQIFKRLIGADFLVTALGEVPPAAVRKLAEAVEARRK